MGRASATKWFRLRVAFALGVLVLLALELSGHPSWPVFLPQALFIVGIIVTSALDLRDCRKSGLSGRSRLGLLIPTGFRRPPGRASCSASARGSPSPRSSTERASPHRSLGEPRGGTLPSPGRGRPDAATLGSPWARTRWERRGSDDHQSDPNESIQSGRAPRSNAPD
jgi:hypothetical protein